VPLESLMIRVPAVPTMDTDANAEKPGHNECAYEKTASHGSFSFQQWENR
jgi:hypothetical protein